MSNFDSDPREFFNWIYGDVPPWDVGRPQPALAELINDYHPPPPILDVGCGSGDLAIHLAQLGHEVVGIDFVEAAIVHARRKAQGLPPEVARLLEFQVADAVQPSLLQRQFGSVVDSGFLHVLDAEQSDRFVDDLRPILLPGGRYYLLAFNIDFSIPNTPRQVSAEEVSARFTAEKGWRILDIHAAEFHSRVAPPVPATAACIERLPPDLP